MQHNVRDTSAPVYGEGGEIGAQRPDGKHEVGAKGVPKEEQDRGRRDKRNADAAGAVKPGWAEMSRHYLVHEE